MLETLDQRRTGGGRIGAVRVLLVMVAVVVAAWNSYIVAAALTARPLLLPAGGSDAYVGATVLPQVLQLDWLESSHCGDLADGEICHTVSTSVRAEEIPLWIRAVAVTPQLLEAIAIVVALLAVRRALQYIAWGQPFAGQVRAGLRTAAVVLVVGTLVRTALHPVGLALLTQWWDGLDGGRAIGMQPIYLSVPLLVGGLVLGSLGVAFREGARLQEDVAGVI